ncbi:MAG: aminopeptidase P family protein [Clostridia bacterium]|nr:aminopeptidase P family protein [Clostridia bacterium]
MDTLKRLQEKMRRFGMPAALILSDEQRFYLSGFKSSAGFMLVFQNDAYLFVDSRYYEAAKLCAASLSYEVRLFRGKITSYITALMKDKNISVLYFEDDLISFADFRALHMALEKIELKQMGAFISDLRMIKTVRELENIRRAQKESEDALMRVMGRIGEGMTEREIALMLEWEIRTRGMDASFDFIVASGQNSSKPHAVPTDRRLKRGDFLTIDFGAKYKGYCADMTRTFSIGSPSDEMRSVYETVREAKNAAERIIRAGLKGSEIDRAARAIIEEAGYGAAFGHSLGHGVGVVVHEQPNFAPMYEREIPGGAVVSVEPGIYLEGRFGVRIEDLVFVDEDAAVSLNSMTTELIEL